MCEKLSYCGTFLTPRCAFIFVTNCPSSRLVSAKQQCTIWIITTPSGLAHQVYWRRCVIWNTALMFFFVKLLIFCFSVCEKNRYDLMGTFVYHHKLDSLSCDTSHGRGIPPLPQNPLCPLMICPPWTTPSRMRLLGSSCQLLGEDDSLQRRGTGRSESEGRPNLTAAKKRTEYWWGQEKFVQRVAPKRKGWSFEQYVSQAEVVGLTESRFRMEEYIQSS